MANWFNKILYKIFGLSYFDLESEGDKAIYQEFENNIDKLNREAEEYLKDVDKRIMAMERKNKKKKIIRPEDFNEDSAEEKIVVNAHGKKLSSLNEKSDTKLENIDIEIWEKQIRKDIEDEEDEKRKVKESEIYENEALSFDDLDLADDVDTDGYEDEYDYEADDDDLGNDEYDDDREILSASELKEKLTKLENEFKELQRQLKKTWSKKKREEIHLKIRALGKQINIYR